MDGKYWAIFSLVFILLEMVAPGFFLLWIGVAAGMVSLSSIFFSLDVLSKHFGINYLFLQVVLFAIYSSVLIYFAAKNKPKLNPGDRTLNNKNFRLIGRTVKIKNIDGRDLVDVDDTLWFVVEDQAGQFSVGDTVRVQAFENGRLRLIKIETNDQ